MNMADKKLSKKTSTIVVAILLLGSVGLATAAATDATETLLPMLQGKQIAYERGLSRNSVALAVHVSSFDGAERSPLEGAIVSVTAIKTDVPTDDEAPHWVPCERPVDGEQTRMCAKGDHSSQDGQIHFAMKRTDADGRTIFDLRPGRYIVAVQYEDLAGRGAISLAANTRMSVTFDEEGQAHFHEQGRTEAQQTGPTVPLIVRAFEYGPEGRSPIAGAKIAVYKAERDENGEPVFKPYARNLTNEHGGAAFQVPVGAYKVQIGTPDGSFGEHRLRIAEATGLYALFDEDGDAHFRVMTRDSTPPERPQERPSTTDTRPDQTKQERPSPEAEEKSDAKTSGEVQVYQRPTTTKAER